MIIPSILNIPKEKIYLELLRKNFRRMHFDIADGKFVKQKNSFSPDFIKTTKMKAEIHLMVSNPEKYIKKYSFAEIIYVHVETGKLEKCIELGKKYDVKIGAALNPESKVSSCEVKKVLLMGVHPGRSGQKFIPEVLKKMNNLEKNEVTVDGGVTEENLKKIKKTGVKNIVTASGLFKGSLEENIKVLKKLEKSN